MKQDNPPSSPTKSGQTLWTKSIIILMVINVVFLLLIGFGLVLVIPPLIDGFADYGHKTF
jgi:hypothetical protein